MTYTIDTRSDKTHYIIKRDGKEVCKISKINKLDEVKNYFKIEVEE